MIEKIPEMLSGELSREPEGKNDTLSPEELAILDDYLLEDPDKTEQFDREDCIVKIEEINNLFESFEKDHDLYELNKITHLLADEAPNHPVRQPALLALTPIVTLKKILDEQNEVTDEEKEELEVMYKKISRAVGTINRAKGVINRR